MKRTGYMRISWRRPLPRWLDGPPMPDDRPFTRWEWFLARHPRVRLVVDYIGSLYR